MAVGVAKLVKDMLELALLFAAVIETTRRVTDLVIYAVRRLWRMYKRCSDDVQSLIFTSEDYTDN